MSDLRTPPADNDIKGWNEEAEKLWLLDPELVRKYRSASGAFTGYRGLVLLKLLDVPMFFEENTFRPGGNWKVYGGSSANRRPTASEKALGKLLVQACYRINIGE